MREVNARPGRVVLRIAAARPLIGVDRDTSNESGRYDVRGKSCF